MGPYTAAQLHKLDLYPGFGEEVLAYLPDPTPFMPPSRLLWTRRLNRPVMDPEDPEHVFEAQVLRGELVRFGDTQVQYAWRPNETALPRAVRGPASAAPRHAWCMSILHANQDGDFWEQWRQRYRTDWPLVTREGATATYNPELNIVENTYIHPQLWKYSRIYTDFVRAWMMHEECYVGTREMQLASEYLGRNIVLDVQRDRVLARLRQYARENAYSFAWAI